MPWPELMELGCVMLDKFAQTLRARPGPQSGDFSREDCTRGSWQKLHRHSDEQGRGVGSRAADGSNSGWQFPQKEGSEWNCPKASCWAEPVNLPLRSHQEDPEKSQQASEAEEGEGV